MSEELIKALGELRGEEPAQASVDLREVQKKLSQAQQRGLAVVLCHRSTSVPYWGGVRPTQPTLSKLVKLGLISPTDGSRANLRFERVELTQLGEAIARSVIGETTPEQYIESLQISNHRKRHDRYQKRRDNFKQSHAATTNHVTALKSLGVDLPQISKRLSQRASQQLVSLPITELEQVFELAEEAARSRSLRGDPK